MAESACFELQMGAQGKIYVSHPDTAVVSILDGYTVKTLHLPEKAEKRVFESPGGQLWTIVPNGLAEMGINGHWNIHPETNIVVLKSGAGAEPAIALHPVRQGVVLFLLPDRLMEFNRAQPLSQRVRTLHHVSATRLGKFLSLAPARDGGLWVIGQSGLAKFNGPVRSLNTDSELREFIAPASVVIEEAQSFNEDTDGGFTLAAQRTEDQHKVAVRFDGTTWKDLAPLVRNTRFVWRGPNQEDWAVDKNSLYRLKNGRWDLVRSESVNKFQYTAVLTEANGTFWLGTSEGLLRHAQTLWRTPAGSLNTNHPNTRVAVANGTNVIGKLRNGALCILSDDVLHVRDGEGARAFPYPAPPVDASGPWVKLFQAENRDLWLGSHETIAWFHDGRWDTFSSDDKSTPEGIIDFAELSDGTIWCATRNKIWEFNGRDWIALRAGFDQIHCLLRSRNGSVWIGSSDGLHHFYRGIWTVHGMEEGLPSNIIGNLYENQDGHIVAQCPGGVSFYFPEADRDPPATHILSYPNARISEGGALRIDFSARDRWKYATASRLLFSYRLDENEWAAFEPATNLWLTELTAGNHTVQVRAMDRNGNIDPQPATLEFVVALPWYKERRLLIIAMAGAAVAIFFGVIAYNRHRRLLLSYAEMEQKIADRTRELELAHKELLHSQKMNAMGSLAAGIAHDFNNILSIIKGSVQLIEENFDDRQTVQSRLDRIKTMVSQGSGVIKAMLGFARADTPLHPQNLNELVADTVKLLGDRFHREVSIQVECDPRLPSIVVSREFVQQILLNLIFNAAEAATDRKRIIISTQLSDHLPPGTVLKPGGEMRHGQEQLILISVQDYGCGIPAEIMPRIFEPFFTTKAFSTRRGTGLGLSMVYNLCRKMGAGIAVQSVVNGGSVFTLILDRSVNQSVNLSAEPNHPTAASISRR